MSRLELIHRRTAPPKAPEPPPPRPNIYNTVHRTVVHLHQTNVQQVRRQITAAGRPRRDALLLLLPRLAALGGRSDRPDPARPARTACALIRIFSRESAKRELRPFYRDVFRGVLREEQERYKSRPAQAVRLVWSLFGQHGALRTLRRFCLGAAERLGCFPVLGGHTSLYLTACALMRSRVCRRYIRRLWSREVLHVPRRCSGWEGPAADGLLCLTAARSAALPPREVLERMALSVSRETAPARPAPGQGSAQGEMRLSEADFRALVRGVADSLERRSRLESLKKGGASYGEG